MQRKNNKGLKLDSESKTQLSRMQRAHYKRVNNSALKKNKMPMKVLDFRTVTAFQQLQWFDLMFTCGRRVGEDGEGADVLRSISCGSG